MNLMQICKVILSQSNVLFRRCQLILSEYEQIEVNLDEFIGDA